MVMLVESSTLLRNAEILHSFHKREALRIVHDSQGSYLHWVVPSVEVAAVALGKLFN